MNHSYHPARTFDFKIGGSADHSFRGGTLRSAVPRRLRGLFRAGA